MPHLFSLVYVFNKYVMIAIACIFAGNGLFGQNLVPNPSFEDNSELPSQFNVVDFNHILNHWYSGNAFPPAYCHTLAIMQSNVHLGWPNPTNKQMPRTGNGSLLYGAMYYLGFQGFNAQRNYPCVKLIQTLPMGSKVYGEFYVSAHEFIYGSNLRCNNHGMLLQKDSISDFGANLILATPQINKSDILFDTLNWVKVSGTFIAQTDLNYLAIGNFFTDGATNYYMDVLNHPNDINRAWTYLDDVKVRILNPQVQDTIRVCQGDVATIIAYGEENHQWAFAHTPSLIENTDSVFSFTPDSNVAVNFYGSFDTLTTYIIVDALEINLGIDTVICVTDVFWLKLSVAADQVIWNNTTATDSIKVTHSGYYTVKATNGACVKTDSIYIDVVDFYPPKIYSEGSVCLGDEQLLWVEHQPYATYLWSTGATDSMIVVAEDGDYSVQVLHPCGNSTDQITIEFDRCVCHFFLANAFSPNGDGVNDTFFPVFDCSIKNYQMTITDRWGNIVFYTTNPYEHWDGENAQLGIYVVNVKYQGLNEEGRKVRDEFTQTLTLVR